MWNTYEDKSLLLENISSLDKYMDWLKTRGFKGPLPTYGDWLAYDPIPNDYISKTYYALDVQIMSKLHCTLGNHDKAEEYNNLYYEIRKDFRNTYMSNGDLLPEYRKQTGYLLALHTDMFDSDEIVAAADALEKR